MAEKLKQRLKRVLSRFEIVMDALYTQQILFSFCGFSWRNSRKCNDPQGIYIPMVWNTITSFCSLVNQCRFKEEFSIVGCKLCTSDSLEALLNLCSQREVKECVTHPHTVHTHTRTHTIALYPYWLLLLFREINRTKMERHPLCAQ